MRVFVTLIFLAFLSLACTAKTESSKPTHLSAVPSARNIALLIGAPLEEDSYGYLSGVDEDLKNLKKILESTALDFEVHILRNESPEMILKYTYEAARAVGTFGTLFWYYSGHGIKDGRLVLKEDDGYGNPVTLDSYSLGYAMTKARLLQGTPLRRLMMIFDSCYSGQWNVAAQGSILEFDNALVNDFHTNMSMDGLPYLFEEYASVTASRPNELSAELPNLGGAFSYALQGMFQYVDDQTTIYEWLAAAAKYTAETQEQTPTLRTIPESGAFLDQYVLH